MIVSSRNQSLLGPRQKPIYGCTIDQTGECSQSPSEILSNRRHANHHVKITLAQVYEELIFLIGGAIRFYGADIVDYFCFFFRWEQIRDLAVVQDIADFLHHTFSQNLSV